MGKTKNIAFYIGVLGVAVFVLGNVIASNVHSNDRGGNGTEVDTAQVQEEKKERVVEEVKTETIPYDTQTIDDDSVEYGKTVVRTEGVNGERTYAYRITYVGEKEIKRELVKNEITKQPVTKVIVKGTKVVWHCSDATSYDRNPNNDNLCVSSTGEGRYVSDCEAVRLDPDYYPPQYGAARYNGCAR